MPKEKRKRLISRYTSYYIFIRPLLIVNIINDYMDQGDFIEGGDQMGLLSVIILVLLVMWLGGIALHIAGGFINILLVVAVVLLFMRFFRRAV